MDVQLAKSEQNRVGRQRDIREKQQSDTKMIQQREAAERERVDVFLFVTTATLR